ncbi:MAG TPA: ATP-binding protein, partial [Desulfosarcina sp.]|nr:ATP-binding protein [Desulfosarcina sp.]
AGGIAHDFNNILFPIVGLSEMLIEDLPDGSFDHENAAEIHKAARRAGDLVKQILSFSRQIEQRKMPIRIQPVLKEIVKLMRATIPSNISITQSIPADCGMVLADPTQIHQIAMNLITNAYHAVEASGGRITIGLKEARMTEGELVGTDAKPGNYAVLSIADTGHGIDPRVIDKIFDPYFTTKTQGKGTGLGLAVVYGIVKDHGGFLQVDSEVGQGSTFSVHLPILNDAGEENPSADDIGINATGSESILLVDDEAAVVKLEKQMLERMGYHIEERVSSIEALKAFEAKPDAFDLVITDMTMPHMTGDQLARKLMSIRKDIPVIICTGFSERIDNEKAAALGVKGVLFKPVVKSDMARMIRKVLDEAKSFGR